MSSDKLCKRYLFNLEMIVKSKASASKKIEGPPRMLYLRELYASIHQVFKEPISAVVRTSVVGLPPRPRSRADRRLRCVDRLARKRSAQGTNAF